MKKVITYLRRSKNVHEEMIIYFEDEEKKEEESDKKVKGKTKATLRWSVGAMTAILASFVSAIAYGGWPF